MEPAVASLGIPYRFQHPEFRMGVVLDFALLSPRVAIEVDGRDHSQPKKRLADQERTRRLEALGWTVVRCQNEEALSDPYSTLDRMLAPWGLRTVRPGSAPQSSPVGAVEASPPSSSSFLQQTEPPAAPPHKHKRQSRK